MELIIKIVIVTALLFVIFNLFKAMFTMISPKPNQPSMSKFIGRRLIFSVLVLVILLICLAFGVITPNPRPY